jgi:hypothetical protein
MTQTVYTVPDNFADPEAAALELIVRRPSSMSDRLADPAPPTMLRIEPNRPPTGPANIPLPAGRVKNPPRPSFESFVGPGNPGMRTEQEMP